MVEPALKLGKAGCVSESSEVEKPVKNTTRKRKLHVSPDIRQRLQKFKKENPTDSPVKSFFKQFQYKGEAGEERMTRSRRASSSSWAKSAKESANEKEPLNEGGEEKSLKEGIRDGRN